MLSMSLIKMGPMPVNSIPSNKPIILQTVQTQIPLIEKANKDINDKKHQESLVLWVPITKSQNSAQKP